MFSEDRSQNCSWKKCITSKLDSEDFLGSFATSLYMYHHENQTIFKLNVLSGKQIVDANNEATTAKLSNSKANSMGSDIEITTAELNQKTSTIRRKNLIPIYQGSMEYDYLYHKKIGQGIY
jgi:hypothetical protein